MDQQLQERLTLIETSDEQSTTVPDLPLRDFVVAVIILAVAIAALMWWAY
ncbi:MAG: hypothetical protein ACSLFA_06805 [Mycobacterium sp.]